MYSCNKLIWHCLPCADCNTVFWIMSKTVPCFSLCKHYYFLFNETAVENSPTVLWLKKMDLRLNFCRFIKLFVYYNFLWWFFFETLQHVGCWVTYIYAKGDPRTPGYQWISVGSWSISCNCPTPTNSAYCLGNDCKLLCNSGQQKSSKDSNVCIAGECISLFLCLIYAYGCIFLPFLVYFSLLQVGIISGLALAVGLYASFGNIAKLFTSDPEVLMVVKSCALVNLTTLLLVSM